jgi:hypothetical protein
MMGSIVKSGGMPPFMEAEVHEGEGAWKVYLGFFLVGLSQPLYQCTPALLSASWFPEVERTMATGVALNANQLGIGFAFIFGTLLVASKDDIPGYFGLLSIISTLTFFGTLIQFEDAPPTPPSETAKVVRGTLEVKLPSVQTIFDSVRNIGSGGLNVDERVVGENPGPNTASTAKAAGATGTTSGGPRRSSGSRRSARGATATRSSGRRGSGSGNTRRKNVNSANAISGPDGGFGLAPPGPSPARWGRVSDQIHQNERTDLFAFPAPSPMMPGPVEQSSLEEEDESDVQQEGSSQQPFDQHPYLMAGVPYNPYMYSPYQSPYGDPRFHQFAYYHQQAFPEGYPAQPDPYFNYYSYQHAMLPPYARAYQFPQAMLPPPEAAIDEGVEPVLTLTPHHLDINIRDDQVWRSIRACFSRPGFIHALVSFTVSGIVINTLSTFMDFLVRLGGAGREYTGIVGGSFQFVIMISSLTIGKLCDNTRAYYSVTVGMLVLGAFGLAMCGVSLDEGDGRQLRWSLVVVAALVGPLQPVSTELGVDVVYPLSENTVLVIQQLFSNLLSAGFIPMFKHMKDVGRDETSGKPEYTFSFYLLIVLHAAATVFFATFNGRYLRYEHELEKKAKEELRKKVEAARAFHRINPEHHYGGVELADEHTPLIPPVV